MRVIFTAVLILFAFSANPAFAQDSWRINLKNADIREFVTQVSAITGKSFIIDPRVKGNVTVVSNTAMGQDSAVDRDD